MSGFDHIALNTAIAEHGSATRILILSTKGSAPRAAGCAMLVTPHAQSGTIGGGALEWQATKSARALPTPFKIQTIPLGPDLGQCCGGSVTLLFERFTQEIQPGENGYARPISAGAKTQTPFEIQAALQNARRGAPPQMLQAEHWLYEPLSRQSTPIWLYGAGHVGRAVVQTLNALPFDITWIDTEPNRFPAEIPQDVTQLVAQNPADVTAYAPQSALHIVMTFSHALDLDICAAVLARPHGCLGLIGSATKAARFRKRLATLGHDPAMLTCPIGDPSLGKEPGSIAIGLASELLRLQNKSLTFGQSRIPA